MNLFSQGSVFIYFTQQVKVIQHKYLVNMHFLTSCHLILS